MKPEQDTKDILDQSDSQPGGQQPQNPGQTSAPQKSLEQALVEADENLKGWQRAAADFENYKRRDEQLHTELVAMGQDQVIHVLLRWLDDLGRILAYLPETSEGLAEWKKGIDGVIRSFEGSLSELSLERIKTVGETFDPRFHEAVSQVEGGEEGIIAEEISPGFRRGDRLFKAAQVKVYKPTTNQ